MDSLRSRPANFLKTWRSFEPVTDASSASHTRVDPKLQFLISYQEGPISELSYEAKSLHLTHKDKQNDKESIADVPPSGIMKIVTLVMRFPTCDTNHTSKGNEVWRDMMDILSTLNLQKGLYEMRSKRNEVVFWWGYWMEWSRTENWRGVEDLGIPAFELSFLQNSNFGSATRK